MNKNALLKPGKLFEYIYRKDNPNLYITKNKNDRLKPLECILAITNLLKVKNINIIFY